MIRNCLLLCLCCLIGASQAQTPIPTPGAKEAGQVKHETVADRPSALYRFETHEMVSADGQRTYRIDLSIPRKPPSNKGYPVLYMLDGNATMVTLTDQDLASVSGGNPLVLVAIGYDTPDRLDVKARSYDYTPPVLENGKRVQAPAVRGRVGGGADIFLHFINTQIKPLVRARANIDSRQESLWGHSYGGLFVLHTLFTQPNAFGRYIMGDPSAWWYDGAIMQDWENFDTSLAIGKQVTILVGTRAPATRRTTRQPPPPQSINRAAFLRTASKKVTDGLRQAGVQASYEEFPEYGHGDMSRVSLERALQDAARP
ncbi:alpha/beta hydrolase [Alcaligenaceae bacterium]|nr:alpha/beta hydrolase [Alcaligenaceae bacterium]